jgi:hypothetical protein
LGEGHVGHAAQLALGHKAQKESSRIPVREDRMASNVALADQPVIEVGMEKLREVRAQ